MADNILTPELEREILAVRCQMRRERAEHFCHCAECGEYRPKAPRPMRPAICVDCYSVILERAVRVAELPPPESNRKSSWLWWLAGVGVYAAVGWLVWEIVTGMMA